MLKGLVNRIIPFSYVDGPGNRTAIFLQGCNFNCVYCHNPETITLCNQCGACIHKCPVGALSLKEQGLHWNETRCVACDACLKACARNSSPKTSWLSVEETMEIVKKYLPFISGITVSGGECTLQVEYLTALFKEVKKLKLTTLIDTNASQPFVNFTDLLAVTDGVMVDLKAFDLSEHQMLTGKDNLIVKQNVEYLARTNKLYEVRTVIVPGLLDNELNVQRISQVIARLNPEIIYKLIRYRPQGVRTDLLNADTPTDQLMSELKSSALGNGCRRVITC